MLNPASRPEENAEAHFALLRPLAIFFVIALALAVTSRQPVEAKSRDRSPHHAASASARPTHVLTHSFPVARHRAENGSAKPVRAASHEAVEPAASGRRHRRSVAARRGSVSRSVVVKDVAMSRPADAPMAQPIAGVNSMVEATPAIVASSASHSVPADITAAGTSASSTDLAQAAVQPRVTPMYTRTGRLIVPPPLRGSREILVHQNQMADAAGLQRIQNDDELDRLRDEHQLVDVAGTSSLHINPELPANRRSARPWTAKFASDIARAYYARFGQPLELNSAVRTISYQIHLQRVNGNAAAIDGETASPHLTGQAIDFGKKGMTMAQIAWMRMYLTPLMQAGMIDVEEEFQQACFHISVYRSYGVAQPDDLAQVRRTPGALAAATDLAR